MEPGQLIEHIIREIEDTPDLSGDGLGVLISVAAIPARAHHEEVAEQAAVALLDRI